jgi:hypothetical protein
MLPSSAAARFLWLIVRRIILATLPPKDDRGFGGFGHTMIAGVALASALCWSLWLLWSVIAWAWGFAPRP